MYRPRHDYGAKYQFSSGWANPPSDDEYFQRRAHDDHTNNYKYQQSGWQSSPNDQHFQQRAHDDHTNSYKYQQQSGWQASPNDEYRKAQDDYTNSYKYQQSRWQASPNDEYRKAHDDYTNSYKYPQQSGWQASSPNDDYFTVARTERTTIRTVEAPLFPNLNATVTETVIQEETPIRRDEHVPIKAREHVRVIREETPFRRDEHVNPKAREHVRVKKHVHYEMDNKEGKLSESHDENVDEEADNFIKQKHRKFELSKLLSMKAF